VGPRLQSQGDPQTRLRGGMEGTEGIAKGRAFSGVDAVSDAHPPTGWVRYLYVSYIISIAYTKPLYIDILSLIFYASNVL
jgi:hypothetical protein